jgi:hypothetical protein
MDVLSNYALTVFTEEEFGVSPYMVSLVLQLALTLGILLSPALMTRLNRRPHFVSGCVGIALIHVTLGIDSFFGVSASQPLLRYLPVLLITAFGFAFGLGLSAPYVLSGELFTQQTRAWGCAIPMAGRYVFQFVQLKTFLGLVAGVGLPGFYFVQAITALLGAGLALALLPETRGKTFAQLEVIFQGRGEGKGMV